MSVYTFRQALRVVTSDAGASTWFLRWCIGATAAMALVAAGCSSDTDAGAGGGNNNNGGTLNNGEPGCRDHDGDGFGDGCSAGADCDDANSVVHDCDCATGNFAGCACSVTGGEACFTGLATQEGVGACRGGNRDCSNGQWSACIGEIAPTAEICDGFDNDCDGQTDEELPLNPCGTCDPLCDGQSVGPRGGEGTGGEGSNGGPATGWGLSADNGDGLVENDEGGLELSSDDLNFNFLYTANSEEGTVSKVDTRDGKEIARYVSGLSVVAGQPDSLAGCNPNDGNPPGNCPSRTAVDLRGDVWVANRAFNGVASVTKISNRDCVDKNGDGIIQTSHDANGNGRIERNSPEEFYGVNDECILFTVPLGGNGGDRAILRALAVDPFTPERGYGSVWVGAWNLQKYYQLSGRDGSLIREVNVPHRPYGAVMDRFGVLWSTDTSAFEGFRGLVKIVSETGQVEGPIAVRGNGCSGAYGITVDGDDNIWLGGWNCERAFRYTPSSDSWLTVQLPNNTGVGRGIAADRNGWVYVGTSYTSQGDPRGYITRFRKEDGSQMQRFDSVPLNGVGTIGVGLDYQDRVWGVNQISGNATRLDPTTGEITVFPVGPGPYTYSDFTGYQLRSFTAPQGTYRRVFAACPMKDYATWEKVIWTADQPPGTTVSVRVKSVYELADLISAEQFGPFDSSPAELAAAGVPDGKYLEVEVIMTSDTPGLTPTLWGLDVVWACPPVL